MVIKFKSFYKNSKEIDLFGDKNIIYVYAIKLHMLGDKYWVEILL